MFPGEAKPEPALNLMSELAKQIIRQQWPLRNHPDPRRRGQARSLIRTHVILLRSWRVGTVPTQQEATLSR